MEETNYLWENVTFIQMFWKTMMWAKSETEKFGEKI